MTTFGFYIIKGSSYTLNYSSINFPQSRHSVSVTVNVSQFDSSTWYVLTVTFDYYCTGAVLVVIVWSLDLQLPVKVVGSNPVHDQMYSIKHYVIKFVSDLRQVGGFL